jgi:hypothetical protein
MPLPLIVPALLLRTFDAPPTTAGFGVRWRTLFNDGVAGRTTLDV